MPARKRKALLKLGNSRRCMRGARQGIETDGKGVAADCGKKNRKSREVNFAYSRATPRPAPPSQSIPRRNNFGHSPRMRAQRLAAGAQTGISSEGTARRGPAVAKGGEQQALSPVGS